MTGFSWSRACVCRRNRRLVALAALYSACSLPAFAQGHTGPPTVDVSIVNSVANPVPVTPLKAPYLFHANVDAIEQASGEECVAIPVPEGRRVVLETVAAELGKDINLAGPPVAYVRTEVAFSTGSRAYRGLRIPVTEEPGGAFHGQLRTMAVTGQATTTEENVSLSLCARAGSAVRAVLFGHLLPL